MHKKKRCLLTKSPCDHSCMIFIETGEFCNKKPQKRFFVRKKTIYMSEHNKYTQILCKTFYASIFVFPRV